MKTRLITILLSFIPFTGCSTRSHILSVSADTPGKYCGPLGIHVKEGAEVLVRVNNERVPFKFLATGILNDIRGSHGHHTKYIDTIPSQDIRAFRSDGLSYLLVIDADIRYSEKKYKGVIGTRSVDEMVCEPIPGGRCTLVSKGRSINTETSSRVQNVEKMMFTLSECEFGKVIIKGHSEVPFTLKESIVQVLTDINDSICK